MDLILRHEDSPTPKRPLTRLSTPSGLRFTHKSDFHPNTNRQNNIKFCFDSHIRLLDSKEHTASITRATTHATATRLRLTRNDLYERLILACSNTQKHSEFIVDFRRERKEQSQALKRWHQTQSRLMKIRDCEADLLVPMYVLEKSSELINAADVRDTVRERKKIRLTRTPQPRRRL